MNPLLVPIDALNRAGVRYVVVGGFAAVMLGVNRVTADIDIVLDLDPAQVRRAIEALLAVGLSSRLPVDPRLFADPATRDKWIREKHMLVFTMIDAAGRGVSVNLFVESPVDFENLFARSSGASVQGTSLRLCAIDDLIDMKRAAGRPRDLLDVADLELIRDRLGGGSAP